MLPIVINAKERFLLSSFFQINSYKIKIWKDAHDRKSYRELGQLLLRLGRTNAAVRCFRSAVFANPKSYWLYGLLVEALHQRLSKRPALLQQSIKLQKQLRRKLIAELYPDLPTLGDKQPLKPSFIIIGQQKCGTTSLYSYLMEHPQMLPPIKKEIHFWESQFDFGFEWYESHFPAAPLSGDFLTGEASASYFNFPQAAHRISRFYPDIKLIILLREPVERAVSHYYMNVRNGKEARSLMEALKPEIDTISSSVKFEEVKDVTYGQYMARGCYSRLLEPWVEAFPRRQLLILRTEDLESNTQAEFDKVTEFLELPSHKLSNLRKWNSQSYDFLSESEQEQLKNYFYPHNQLLEEAFGIRFSSL